MVFGTALLAGLVGGFVLLGVFFIAFGSGQARRSNSDQAFPGGLSKVQNPG